VRWLKRRGESARTVVVDRDAVVPQAQATRDAPLLGALAGSADRIAVLDCETTGVYSSDRILEIAIVTVGLDGHVIEAWETLVFPARDVGASHIHGLTAEAVRDAPTFADVSGDVAVRLHGACIAAHNLPFDTRMVREEFRRLGTDVTVLSGIDTLTATRCRLATACSTYDISLDNAHSALGDALATASLLKYVHSACEPGSAAAAPVHLIRSGRVLRRADASLQAVPDPPYIINLLASLDLAGLEARTLAYLEVLQRALADVHLDASERRELGSLAANLGLDGANLAQAHRRLVNDLIDRAMEDHVVTPDELDMLMRIASSVEVDASTVEHRTSTARTSAMTITLGAGMSVVFTGDDPAHPRDELVAHAKSIELKPSRGVTKATDLIVAYDPESSSGKAKKARAYGIPIIATSRFATAAPGDVIEASGTGGGLKVVTCPECHRTWTESARSGARTQRRCSECSGGVFEERGRTSGQPTSETLECSQCGRSWTRERRRGRKPQRCPTCS
jgi:DNA polymerase-3 subunit epsilon